MFFIHFLTIAPHFEKNVEKKFPLFEKKNCKKSATFREKCQKKSLTFRRKSKKHFSRKMYIKNIMGKKKLFFPTLNFLENPIRPCMAFLLRKLRIIRMLGTKIQKK